MFEITVTEQGGKIVLTAPRSSEGLQHTPDKHQVRGGKKVRWKSREGSIVIYFAKQDRLQPPEATDPATDQPLRGRYANLDFKVSGLWLSAAKDKKTGSLHIKKKVKERNPLKYSVLLFKDDQYYHRDPELEDGDDGGGKS